MVKPREPAALSTVEALAQEWSDENLECRAARHAWGNRTRFDFGAMSRIQRECLHRCGCVKQQVIYNSGAIDRQWIEYPDGYLSPRGTGRVVGLALDVIRAEQLRRDKRVPAKVTPIKRRKPA